MKKIIYSMLACLSMLATSCSNDDIEISKTVTITVNPSTVISPFQNYVDYFGDSMASNLTDIENIHAQFVVRVVAYDANGNMVAEDKQVLDGKERNYTSTRKFEFFLGDGNYTILAMSYIHSKTSNNDMWNLKDYQKLSTAVIEDPGYVWGQFKMLGLKVQTATFNSSSQSATINLDPACAIIESSYDDVYWMELVGNIEAFGLEGDRRTNKLLFDNNGKYTTQEEPTDIWIYKRTFSSDEEFAWGMTCILPVSSVNIGFYFEGTDNSGKSIYGSLSSDRIYPKAGDCYRYSIAFSYDASSNMVNPSYSLLRQGSSRLASQSRSITGYEKFDRFSKPVKITKESCNEAIKVSDLFQKK